MTRRGLWWGMLAVTSAALVVSAVEATSGRPTWIALALAGVGGVFERAKWARPLETARLVTTAAACAGLALTGLAPGLVAWGGLAFSLVSLAVLWAFRSELTRTELAPLM